MAPPRERRSPRRTCVQCRRPGDKETFLRIAGRPGERWEPDPERSRPGRGLYLCRDDACIGGFARALRTRKGAARWRMGAYAGELADRVEACRRGPDG